MKERYIIRAAKYFAQLVILLGILLVIMNLRDLSRMQIFFTDRGLFMGLIVVAFSLLYPFMGYVKRSLTFNAETNADEFKRVMSMNGYEIISNEAGTMVFRASAVTKRAFLMWEDQIEVKTEEGLSTISGPRREVVRTQLRCQTYIQ